MFLFSIIVGLCIKKLTNKVILGWGCYSVVTPLLFNGFVRSFGDYSYSNNEILLSIPISFFLGLAIIFCTYKIKNYSQRDKITEDTTSLDKAESILEESPAPHVDTTEKIENMNTPMPSAETQTEISFYLDLALLEKAQAVAADMGLDLSSAVRMFLVQMIRENALPFTPNANQTKKE